MTWKYLSHICDSFCLSVPLFDSNSLWQRQRQGHQLFGGQRLLLFGLLVSSSLCLSVCAPCLNVDTQEGKWFSRNFPAQTINIGALHNWAGNWIEGQHTPTTVHSHCHWHWHLAQPVKPATDLIAMQDAAHNEPKDRENSLRCHYL